MFFVYVCVCACEMHMPLIIVYYYLYQYIYFDGMYYIFFVLLYLSKNWPEKYKTQSFIPKRDPRKSFSFKADNVKKLMYRNRIRQ